MTAITVVATALMILTINTFRLAIPLCNNRPKSPISCGISCEATAIVVTIPVGTLTKNAAAIATPSIALCNVSPATIKPVVGSGAPLCWWWWWNQCNARSAKKNIKIPITAASNTVSADASCTPSFSKSRNTTANNAPAANGVAYLASASALFLWVKRTRPPSSENTPPISEKKMTW